MRERSSETSANVCGPLDCGTILTRWNKTDEKAKGGELDTTLIAKAKAERRGTFRSEDATLFKDQCRVKSDANNNYPSLNTLTAFAPITSSLLFSSEPNTPFTAAEFVLTESHSLSSSSSGGKNG